MSGKSNLSVNRFIKQTSFNYKKKKIIWKEVLKWVKRIVYIFLFGIALIGCFQQLIDPNIQTSPFVGSGSEICGGGGCINGHNVDPSGNGEYNYFPITSFADAWSHGPFYAFFVFPFSLFLIVLINSMHSSIGLGGGIVVGIFILVFIIRTATLVFTIPQLKIQAHMQTLQVKVAEIKSRYGAEKSSAEKQKQQMEIMNLYKKNNLKPAALFATSFVTLPFFYAMYRSTAMVREVKEGVLGPFNFNATILSEVFSLHQWIYLIPLVIIVPAQVLAMKMQSILNYKKNKQMDAKARKQYKKNQLIFNIMMIVLIFVSINVPFALSLYWFFSNIYTVIQTTAIHYYQKKSRNKGMRLKTA